MPQLPTYAQPSEVWDPTVPFAPVENDLFGREEQEINYLAPLITLAKKAGRDAYLAKLAEIGDTGGSGFTDVVIAIEPTTTPVIRTMINIHSLGSFDRWNIAFRISPSDFLEDDDAHVQSLTVQEAGCEALAAALREAGCPCRVDSRVD